MNTYSVSRCSLTMGSQQWTTEVLRVEVALQAAPGINVLRADLPPDAACPVAAGDPAALALGDGQSETHVFSGAIDSIRQSDSGIRVTALDAGGVLARVRRSATYEHVTPGTLIRALAADAGVQIGRLENGSELTFYAAHRGLTTWDHIHRVSAWLGALVSVSASNLVESVVVQTAHADLAFRYGREILRLDRIGGAAPIQPFTVAGESGAGSMSGRGARRPSPDFYSGNRPQWPPAFREDGKVTATLQPALRPGVVIEIRNAPPGLPRGPMCIWRALHVVTADGAMTTAWFASAGAAGSADGLLGSAVSAVGSFF